MFSQIVVVGKGAGILVGQGLASAPILFMDPVGSFHLLEVGLHVAVLHEYGVLGTSGGQPDRTFGLGVSENEHAGGNGVLLELKQFPQLFKMLDDPMFLNVIRKNL